MNYVDGFVVPVPIAHIDDYRKIAQAAGAIFREHGALAYFEALADDVQAGKLTSFPQSVIMKDDETVVFSWIVYASREQRDEVNAKFMADPRVASIMAGCKEMFDTQRMFWGGFKIIVQA